MAGRTRRQQAASPGWMFYAAGAYTDKNPWWPVMPDTSRYLQRVSFLLRQGEPVADVALYAPTDDAWSQFRPGNARFLNLFNDIHDLIGPKIVPAILDAGHAFDLIDDGTLAEAQRATLPADRAAGREADAGRHEALARRVRGRRGQASRDGAETRRRLAVARHVSDDELLAPITALPPDVSFSTGDVRRSVSSIGVCATRTCTSSRTRATSVERSARGSAVGRRTLSCGIR